MKSGWIEKPLKDICDIRGRIGFRGYKRTDYVSTKEEGAISLSPSNITDNLLDYSKPTYISWTKYEESPEIKIENGDVIFVKTASVGKCAFVENLPHAATINPQFVVFKDIKIEPKLLFYILLSDSFKESLSKKISGVAIPTTTQKSLGEIMIQYPEDIKAQKDVVKELDQIYALVENRKKQILDLKELADSRIQYWFD